ncbi:MAG: DUF2917 domain-containing protein [Nitrospirae bacterium]|nr:DUF2917 domain-containing protein [Nitrospirota bacterium]
MKRNLNHIQPGQRFSGKIEAIHNDTIKILMHDGSLLRIEGGRGTKIFCISGLLWMTQENDLKDYFLATGEEFQVTHPGLAAGLNQ